MWEFHSSYDGVQHRWSWKHFFEGILRESSGAVFASMNEAIRDAIAHGFEMHLHRWQVISSMR